MRNRSLPVLAALILSLAVAVNAVAFEESVDLDAIYRIKQQGLQESQVMDILYHLTDVHGPRLTNSPKYMAAARYSADLMAEWGMVNARLEAWGEFGRGWSLQNFSAEVLTPSSFPLVAFPKAWTPGTTGEVTGEVVMVKVETEADLESLRGTLSGKFVMVGTVPEIGPRWEAQAHRYTDDELAELAMAPDPSERSGFGNFGNFAAMRELRNKTNALMVEEGVLATLEPSARDESGTSGTLFVGSGGERPVDAPPVPPQVVVTSDHYARLARYLEHGQSVTLKMGIAATFHADDLQGYNVFAEIPGSDLADEVVMLGAHLDSWHAGTGATDNASGSAAMMEAARIILKAGLQPRRTIRVALWSGEEQGLLGSRAWVASHLADPTKMELLPEHGKVSAYFNLDNGTGAIRGVYLQGNEAVAPIFEAWMEPFNNLGMSTLTIRNTGGTDHQAFDAVGIPGFQFIQDPMEYRTRSHHSNFDTYERLVPADMMKNATIIAAFAFHAAMRDEMLPRKPLPAPRPNRGPF